MLHNTAKKITNYMVNRQIIAEDTFEIYQYGFEIMISTLLTSLSIMIVASLTDSFQIGILFFLISIPLKATAGGYHASTYFKCFIISNLEYLVISMMAKFLSSFSIPGFIWIGILFACSCYIFKNCPVRNPHHPVDDDILLKNKRFAHLFLFIDCCIIIVLYNLMQSQYLVNFMVLSITAIAIFIFPAKRKEKIS